MKTFHDKITQKLEQILEKNYGISLDHPLWDIPSKLELGDFSCMSALKLASKLKRNPIEIAEEIKKILIPDISNDIEKIEILKPGFINVFISRQYLLNSLKGVLRDKDNFFKGKIKRKILIEFLSANPTGPLSIAHGRQAVIGDVIANVLEFLGNETEREYYLNDAGRQINVLISSVESNVKKINGEDFTFPEDGYKGEYVKDIAEEYIKSGNSNIREFVISHVISLIRKDLDELGIKFNKWFSQKKLIDENKVEESVEKLKKTGLIYENEGAVWFKSTNFGDDKDRVICKADGELTYFASDIAYHKDKVERGYDKLVNLWGPDHHGYINRVKAAIAALTNKKDILKIIIIQLVTIKTKERMSRRAGTAVLLSELIKDVGIDTTRFYYLVRKNSSHLEFDIDLAKELSFENPLYYIQYACARIESIYKKTNLNYIEKDYTEFLNDPQEFDLLRNMLQFSYCLDKTYATLEPVFIIEFLKKLASSFHKFYEKVRVIDDDENITQSRLNLLQGTRIIFHCALGLLGIKPAEKM
ncbi:MAG: arginine--tRNA ligase [Candidatus Omnitrophica bacterium]|nr:arginine--tRNA ligase [Candidatus Omnitrophota bacterium]